MVAVSNTDPIRRVTASSTLEEWKKVFYNWMYDEYQRVMVIDFYYQTGGLTDILWVYW